MKATKKTLKATRAAIREEIKLIKQAVNDEIVILKDQLAKALKREKELVKLSESKIKKILATGER